MDIDSYFDFDSVSSSPSPRTPIDMYHGSVSDLQQPPRFEEKVQHLYAQQPSSTSQQEFFTSSSNPPSFPSTPDYSQSTFGTLAHSPHWPTSPPPNSNVNDSQLPGGEMGNWSYVTNSPQVQRYQSSGSVHDGVGAPSPASYVDQPPQSVNGLYSQQQPQTHQSQYDEQRVDSQYYRRGSNASFTDPSTAFSSPSPHISQFHPQQQPLPQQPQQFYDPSVHRQAHPGYFTEARLSSSHSTSSNASSALSEHSWAQPHYEESPFVHHAPDDSLGQGSVIGTPGSYTSEPVALSGLDPLSLHDYESYDQQQQVQQQQYQQNQYFQQQPQHQGTFSSGEFGGNGVDLNGSVHGSPHVAAQSRQGSGYSNGINQPQHPYGSMGPSESATSLHSIHSQQSLHSQHSHSSLHGQFQQQQPLYPGQQSPAFPAMAGLGGVLPSPPPSQVPGLSSSTLGAGTGVTGMLGGIPGHIAVIHTDDANSKETQFLRRRCFNCRTTDPPSWRRSTLNTGKIVCNKCGLYERTHMRPRPPRFDEMRTGSSSNGSSNAAPSSTSSLGNKARKPIKAGMGLMGGSGLNGGSNVPKGGISKIRKGETRERSLSRASAADSSRRGSFSSTASGTSDWDEGLANYASQHASSASPPNTSNNGIPIPNYNYGPAGSHIYGHSLPYPQLPAHSQSLDTGNGGIRLPRVGPVMGLNRPTPPGVANGSRPTTSSSASGGSGGSDENGSPFAAGISDSTPATSASPGLSGSSPLLQPPRKSATWSSGVGVDTSLSSPSSSTPPPPISAALAFSNGPRSRTSSFASVNGAPEGDHMN